MLGKLLDGRYQVVQVLGSGGFGQTYLAQDTRRPGNPICVVKHLKPASTNAGVLDTARRLFHSEGETLEQLGHHDQIPRLLAYFEENQEFYLVQEFIEGHTLGVELPPGQRWAESGVMQLLQEVLTVLEFVHHRGVIHRDIKPDNLIRRTLDNKIVLVDFGAVKQVRTQTITASGQVSAATVAIGTPGYMATEQAQGRPRPSSDIYSLGIIAIQALTGLAPLQLQEDLNTGELLWQHLVSVSPRLGTVLNKMVRYHFKDRYQSATEALQELALGTVPPTQYPTQPGQSQLPLTEPTLPPPVVSNYSPPRRSSKLPLIIGTGMLVGVVGALSLAIITNRRSHTPIIPSPNPTVNSQQEVCTVVIDTLNIRSGSGTSFNIVDTVKQGQKLSLTTESQNGWLKISSPIEGWVFNRSDLINCPQTQPISIPVQSPKPTPTKPKPIDNGSDTLATAKENYQNGDLNGAVELAKSIPSSSSAYQDARKSIQQWQQEWAFAENKFNEIQQAFNEGRWDDVIAYENDTEFPEQRYWRGKLNELIEQARQKKAEEPTPEPTTTTEPSPTPTIEGQSNN